MIVLFKQKAPANIVLLFLFGLLIKLPLFLYPRVIVVPQTDGRLYTAFINSIGTTGGGGVIASIIALFVLYIQALMVNYMINEYRLTVRQTFLPAMAFMLITSLLPEWSYMSAVLLSNLFIILMFIILFSLYNVSAGNGRIYNIGLLAGLASYLFFPSIFFSISVMIGLMILRPFRLNELFLLVMGALTPYYFHAAYLFLYDQLALQQFFQTLYLHLPPLQHSLWVVAAIVLLCIPFLLGGFYIQLQLRKMLIQARKNWSILLVYLLISFLIPFINSSPSFYTWLLAAAPFACFHACAYLYTPRKWLPSALFTVALLFILLQQYLSTT
ncbi:MAG TPA: hypothetical protein VM187_04090, partial [Niastella sp.]|nr:hypothetical protein [Niastella sp.]